MKNTTNQTYISTSTWWGFITSFLLSTNNRLYVGWFGVLMFPFIAVSTVAYIAAFILAPPVDIDGIREPVAGTLTQLIRCISVLAQWTYSMTNQ